MTFTQSSSLERDCFGMYEKVEINHEKSRQTYGFMFRGEFIKSKCTSDTIFFRNKSTISTSSFLQWTEKNGPVLKKNRNFEISYISILK